MSAVLQYVPNKKTSHFTTSTAAWQVLALNNATNAVTGYATLTALRAAAAAAGNEWPNLDPGAFLQYYSLKSDNAAGADGAAIYVAVNRATAPTDDDAMLIPGGQLVAFPGPLNNIWVRKTTAGDEVILQGAF